MQNQLFLHRASWSILEPPGPLGFDFSQNVFWHESGPEQSFRRISWIVLHEISARVFFVQPHFPKIIEFQRFGSRSELRTRRHQHSTRNRNLDPKKLVPGSGDRIFKNILFGVSRWGYVCTHFNTHVHKHVDWP